jgi:exodeoxyribonuclease V gamma subunit
MDVHIYVVNPCQEYWFEILDRRRLSYLAARGAADGHETGNRLLAHWGRQTQSHVDQLVDALDASMLESAVFVHADSPSLLGRIQDAILDLADLSPGSLPVTDDDRSVEIHLCHSRTRELEALQDYLLGLFSKSASGGYTLQPSDILVVTPDLESTAPAIEAVFSSSPPARNIPWAITGRARSSANVSARALLNLLSLVASRCTAPEVFGSLSQPIVARRFHLDGSSLEVIRNWLRDAGVRWALDTAHRASYEVPSAPRHTLASGFDRLFLGYALPQQQQDPLFGELLPVGNAGDAGARTLGSFWRFGHELQAFQEATASELLPEQWSSLLLGSTETFLAPTEEELGDWNELRDAIAALGASMSLAGGTVPLSVVRAALEQGLEDPARGGIPTGRVTFSSMASLRMLPFRIVCVIGLDDGAFPRAHRPVEFDLMARHGRRGDRQRRDDDRNLFLDLLLAARERLYLSYVGRSIRDNAVLPPSVLVAELLDTLIPAVAADPTDVASLRQARHHLIVEHPLQSFSSTAFSADSDPRIRSHDQELADALRRRVGPRPVGIHQFADEDLDSEFEATGTEGAFFTEALSDPGPDSRAISLSQLVEFFANPSRFLLRNRLGIRLRRAEDELEDTEPLLPDHRQRQALAARLWPFALAGANPGTLRTLALAGIEVADGDLGRTALEREVHELAAFARRAGGAMTSEVLPPTTLTCCVLVEHESWRVHTVLADLRPEGVLRANFQPERPARLLDAWLHHLLLCAACPPGVTPSVAWLFQDGTASFDPPDNPTALLATLIAIYRDGQRRPARFFPRTSQAYVLNGGLRKAREMWQRSDFNPFAESTDPYYRLAFRGTPNALDAQFEACASAVFQPLVAHRRAGV